MIEGLIVGILEQGLIYGIMAMGVYITYTILDFPDLSVDGTFPLGIAICFVMINNGLNPWLALLAAFAAGGSGACSAPHLFGGGRSLFHRPPDVPFRHTAAGTNHLPLFHSSVSVGGV